MDSTLMLQTSTVLFALAALGGVAMALMRFAGTPRPPHWLAMAHGFLAGAALTLLVYAAATTPVRHLALLALLLFVIAAAGGILLNLRFHLHEIALPKWLVLVHGAIAVIGFICLLLAAWT